MSSPSDYRTKPTVLTATIAISETVSDAVPMYGCTPVAVQIPAAFTGTSLTFQGSIDGGATFGAISNADGAITYTVTTDGMYSLNPADFAGYDKIKLVSGTTEVAAREIVVKVFPV